MVNAIFQYKALEPDAPKGIYIILQGEDRKVYPYQLFAMLWQPHTRRLLCEGVEADILIFKDTADCMFFDYRRGRYEIEFVREDFISSAVMSLRQLCDDIFNSRPITYGEEYMRIPHAERLIEGLNAMCIPQNCTQLFSTDVKVEKFTFEFTEEYSCDTEFNIGFGDRFYRSSFSDWSNELEILRYELEGLVVRDRGQVELHFEDDPNIIDVRGCHLHDTRDSSCVKVTFTPDGFVGGPILFGYCKRKEVVEKLYRGFMELFSRDTSWFDDGHEGVTWDEFRANALALLKSQIVEEYLNK